MDAYAGRRHHAADVDGEHVIRQMGSIRRDRDPRLWIQVLQAALVEIHSGDAGQSPHIDPPLIAGQHPRGRRRRDAAVVEEPRR